MHVVIDLFFLHIAIYMYSFRLVKFPQKRTIHTLLSIVIIFQELSFFASALLFLLSYIYSSILGIILSLFMYRRHYPVCIHASQALSYVYSYIFLYYHMFIRVYLRNNSWQAQSCANLHMGWAFIFEFYPKRKREVKSKNIKAQPMCKFAQLYACHELFRF